jgi:hypothetical protein
MLASLVWEVRAQFVSQAMFHSVGLCPENAAAPVQLFMSFRSLPSPVNSTPNRAIAIFQSRFAVSDDILRTSAL